MHSNRYFSTILAAALAICALAGCSKQSRRQHLLDQGDRDFKAQKYDMAEVEYRAALQIPPPAREAIGQLGLLYADEGRISQAFAYLKRAAELEPANFDVQIKLASIYLGARKPKEARNALDKVLDQRPDDEMALQILAETAGQLRDIPQVRQRIQELSRANGDRSGYHLALAVLDLQEQKIADGESELRRCLAISPKSYYALSLLGSVYLEQRDIKQAREAFRSAAELAPLHSPARVRYADLQWQIGATNEAQTNLLQLTQQAPDYLPAWLSLMKMAFAERKLDECQSIIKTILARDPVNFDALMQRGLVSLAQRDGQAAADAFLHLQTQFKDSPQVPFELGAAYLLTGDRTKAVASLNQALFLDPHYSPATMALAELDIRDNRPGAAIGLLEPLAKEQPLAARIQLLLAEAYLVAKSSDQALSVYRHLAEAFPKDSRLQFLIGTVLVQQGDFPGARGAYEKSLQLSPDYLPAFEQLVNMDLDEKKYTAALDRINSALEKDPKTSLLWLLKAKVYVARNDLPQAESVLLKAIKADPDASAPYLYLTRVYVASDKYQEALDRLGALVARTNDVTAFLQIATIQERIKHYDLARDNYEKALQCAPNSSVALNNLAYLYCEHYGDLDKALKMAERARQLAPYSPNTADTLATVLLKKGDYSRALALLQEGSQADPADPEIQFHLGSAYYMLGEEAPARLAFQRSTASTGDFPDKEEARRRLALLAIDPQSAGDSQKSELADALHARPDDPVALIRMAGIRAHTGKLDEAVKLYETILKYNSQNLQAMLDLAHLYASRLNQPEKALALAKSAHALAPDDADASESLGQLVFQSGDYGWSLNLLQEAAHNESRSPDLFYSLALAYYANGDVAQAQSSMRRAIQLNAPFSRLEDARLFLAMIAAAQTPSQTQAAGAEASAILQTNSNYVPALMVSALDQIQQHHDAQAQQFCDRVLANYPQFTPAIRLSGILAYRRDDYARSEELLRRSAQNSGGDDEVNYYLGMDYFRLKRPNDSKKALQRAVSLNPSGKFAAEAKVVLAKLK